MKVVIDTRATQQIAMLDSETGELTERRLEHASGDSSVHPVKSAQCVPGNKRP
ncbi:MAG TPA: hypothetical protein VMT39_01345 [Candidatus Bathyarchaeia archaeon]|nr:hypothetical protein [Candidatus Bathyarchaeia archaeon]